MRRKNILLVSALVAVMVLVAVIAINEMATRASHRALNEAHARQMDIVRIAGRMLSDQWKLLLARVSSLHRISSEVGNALPIWDIEAQQSKEATYRVRDLQNALEVAGREQYPQVILVNAKGVVVWASTVDGKVDVDVSDREHIHAVLHEGGRFFVGRPVLGRILQKMTIPFADAIHDLSGSFVGISVVSVSAKSMSVYLNEVRLGPRDVIAIMRSDDVVIASTKDDIVGSVLDAATVGELFSAEPGQPQMFRLHLPRLFMAHTFRPAGQDYWVAMLVDYEDAMSTALNSNEQRMRYSFVLKCLVVLVGFIVVAGLLLLGHIRQLIKAKQLSELELQVDRDFATAARVGPGVLYRLAFDHADCPTVAMISDAVEQLSGYSPSEAKMPEFCAIAIDANTRPTLLIAIHACRQGLPQSSEFRLCRRDGTRVWVQNSMQPYTDSEGRSGIIGYLLDISAAKQQAHMMAQVGKLATLGEMAAGIAHELRLPIATIAMAADNLRHEMTVLPNDQTRRMREAVERIATQAGRSARLMDHMQIFARTDDGSRGPVVVKEAIDGAMLLADYRIRASRILMDIRIPPDLACIVGHRVLVEQVLVNLVINAIDAYEGDEALDRKIAISAEAVDHFVRICVVDRAGGIGGVDPEQLFAPFYSTKQPSQGTGLGLSFSRRVIQDMDGSITAESIGGGMAFALLLPVFGTNACSAADATLAPAGESGKSSPGSGGWPERSLPS